MTDNDQNSKKPMLLKTILSALVIVVGLQAWQMANMKQQLDELQDHASAQMKSGQPAGKPIESAEAVIQPPQRPARPPSANAQNRQQPNPFEHDRFNRPFDLQDWDPYREMQRMQHEMDQVFNDAFGRFNQGPGFWQQHGNRSMMPDIDLKEENDTYVVLVDLPGTEESDISVTLENNVLTISGQQKYEADNADKYGNTVFRERRSGTFRRSLTLPEQVKEGGMHTELDNGVLKITIPKAG